MPSGGSVLARGTAPNRRAGELARSSVLPAFYFHQAVRPGPSWPSLLRLCPLGCSRHPKFRAPVFPVGRRKRPATAAHGVRTGR